MTGNTVAIFRARREQVRRARKRHIASIVNELRELEACRRRLEADLKLAGEDPCDRYHRLLDLSAAIHFEVTATEGELLESCEAPDQESEG